MQEAFAIGFANVVGAFFRNDFTIKNWTQDLSFRFDLKVSFAWKALIILFSRLDDTFIMRCRPSAFLIHVRISSTKQIFTLDLIFVAHNSCGQNWVIFLFQLSFYFQEDNNFVPRGPNQKQDVKINLIQMVRNLGRCIWSKNYDLKIEKGEFVSLIMWFSTRDLKTGYN